MRLKFFGPLDRVTGSCYELWTDKKHFLIDCGLHQDGPESRDLNHRPFRFDPRTLDFVVLTHAHTDHSGLIPRLYREGFKGEVYATRETAELARLSLSDSAGRKGGLFEQRDVDAIRWREPTATFFGRRVGIDDELSLRFFRTGHVLGAVAVQVIWGPCASEKRITFSGDLGPSGEDGENLPLLRHRMNPGSADYCVVESTYGGHIRPAGTQDHEQRLERLARSLETSFGRGGWTLMPCFALGRCQDLLLDLQLLKLTGRLPPMPVYLDAPLGKWLSRVYARAVGRVVWDSRRAASVSPWLGDHLFRLLDLDATVDQDRMLLVDALQELFDGWHAPRVARRGALAHWKRVWRPVDRGTLARPGLVIASSGMCEGGRIQHYLQRHLRDPRSTILFPGYVASGTVGGRLLNIASASADARRKLQGSLTIDGRELLFSEVRASIATLQGYSAHADQEGLLSWLFDRSSEGEWSASGRTVFVTHGESGPRRALAKAIEARAEKYGLDVSVQLPKPSDDAFDLG